MRLAAGRRLAGAAGALAALAAAGAIGAQPPGAAAAAFGCRASAASLAVDGPLIEELGVANSAGAPCATDARQVDTALVTGPFQPGQDLSSATLDISNVEAVTAVTASSALAETRLGEATLQLPFYEPPPPLQPATTTLERVAPGGRFRTLGVSSFLPWAVRVGEVESRAGYACVNGVAVPFGSSSVSGLQAGASLEELSPISDPPTTGAVDLDETGTVVGHLDQRIVTASEVIQRAIVIERPGTGVRVVVGEARASLDGDPCAPASTTPTAPAPPAPGEARIGAVVSTGRPGDELVITGSGFGASQGADDRITVRDEPAAAVGWSDTRIVVLVPNLTPGPGELRLRVRGVEQRGPAFEIVADPPQPPVVNLLVVPLPGGRVLVDTSLTVDPDTGRAGAPAERGDNSTFDLYDGLRSVLTRIDGGAASRRSTTVAELTPGKHEVEVTATANDGAKSAVAKRLFVPPLTPLQRIAGLTRVRVKPTRVPPADITIPSQLLFDVGSAHLRPEAGRFLAAVARALRIARAPARVVGHTDATGPADFNQRLSRQRARAVRAFLAGRGRVPAGRLTALGRGERDPVAPNSTAAGRQRNRRVVVTIKTPSKAVVLTGPSAAKRVADVRGLQARARAESRRPNRPPADGAPEGIGIYEQGVTWLARGGGR